MKKVFEGVNIDKIKTGWLLTLNYAVPAKGEDKWQNEVYAFDTWEGAMAKAKNLIQEFEL